MQRAKHADRKQRTRALILIGAAAERAGAADLAAEEIEAVLAHYVQTGGQPELRRYVLQHMARVKTHTDGDRNPSTKDDDVTTRPVASTGSVR